jgi:hypothetical protein
VVSWALPPGPSLRRRPLSGIRDEKWSAREFRLMIRPEHNAEAQAGLAHRFNGKDRHAWAVLFCLDRLPHGRAL